MDKEYESYEYLVKYNDNMENALSTGQQVLIVQENGDVINLNKPAEYVAQEENSRGFEGVTCPMFDVNQQPVYFQLSNSSELIPISVNSIPTVEQSTVFENTFLFPTMTVEMIDSQNEISNKQNEISFPPNLKEPSESMVVDSNKLIGGYAEITLNDEQLEILNQKGWILLEMKDKVYLLDSSGLHEITNNNELITKLRHETSQIISKNGQPSRCPMHIQMIPEIANAGINVVPKQAVSGQTEPMQIISGDVTVQEAIANQVSRDSVVLAQQSLFIKAEQGNKTLSDDNNKTVNTKMNPSKICLKTRHLLKDIPKEILLGKTATGKNLIARVIKGKGLYKSTTKVNKDLKSEVGRDRNINDKHFAKLVQRVLRGAPAGGSRTEDIASIESVVSQMFRVPDLRSNLHKHKLIVTKTVREENENGLIEHQSEPTLVTGRFMMNGNEGTFVHLPDMLQQHMKNAEQGKIVKNYKNEIEKTETAIAEDMFLHVNITETKNINNISRISVTVNKRYVSLSQVYNMKTKHINAVYACTACAKIFKSQEELEKHHQLVKLKGCREHLPTNSKDVDQESASDVNSLESTDMKQTEVFKCKLCDNSFIHSSSLTKHILAKHIKQK